MKKKQKSIGELYDSIGKMPPKKVTKVKIIKMQKDVNFSCTGLVHPSEYDWEEQFLEVKNLTDMYIEMDKGKVMGLCKYIKELEYKLGMIE